MLSNCNCERHVGQILGIPKRDCSDLSCRYNSTKVNLTPFSPRVQRFHQYRKISNLLYTCRFVMSRWISNIVVLLVRKSSSLVIFLGLAKDHNIACCLTLFLERKIAFDSMDTFR